MKKILLVMLAFFVSVVVMSGCKQEEKYEYEGVEYGKADTDVKMFQFKVEIEPQLQEIVRVYYRETGTKVEVATVGGGDDYGAALRSEMQKTNAPAIFNVGGLQDVQDWADYLADLSDLEITGRAFSGLLDAVSVDTAVYGLPFAIEGYGLIYNKDMFEEADIDPKEINTFAKLKAAVEKLDSEKDGLGIDAVFALAGKETWVTGLHLSNVAFAQEFSNVVETFNAPNIEFTYASGLQELYDLQSDYSMPNVNTIDYSKQVEEYFATGTVAIIQQGNWAYNAISDIDENVALSTGFLPLPIPGGVEDSIPIGVPMYWAVNSKVDEDTQTKAKDFLNWMYTSEEGQKRIVEDFGFIPAYDNFGDKKPDNPLAQDILKYAQEEKTLPWVFMGYPSGWGMEMLGTYIQQYEDDQLTWEEVVQKSIDDWASERAGAGS